MKIGVKMYGPLRRYVEGGEGILAVPEGARLGDLLQQMMVGEDEAGVIMVNDRIAKTSQLLREGDQVKVLGVVSGG